MFPAERFSLPHTAAGDPGADTAPSADAAALPRVRQLCPAGVTPGAPWRNGAIPFVAYIIYTPTCADACALPARP